MMDCLLDKIKIIATNYSSIRKIVLFGSRARGNAGKTSDYDIAVFGCDENDKILFLSDIDDLPELRKIDVLFVENGNVNKSIYDSIKKEGIIIMDKFQDKLSNFTNALYRLKEGIAEFEENHSLTVRDGVIQRFEFTAELSWKTAREYLLTLQVSNINNPKAVMMEAFGNNLIEDDIGWAKLLTDRNHTSHLYDDAEAQRVFENICNIYVALFENLLKKLKQDDCIYRKNDIPNLNKV